MAGASSSVPFTLGPQGLIFEEDCSTNRREVRPVLYLDSSVYLITGIGTRNNPYIVGM